MKGIVRISEVCDLLSVSRQTLRNYRLQKIIAEPRSIKGTGIKGWSRQYIHDWLSEQMESELENVGDKKQGSDNASKQQ